MKNWQHHGSLTHDRAMDMYWLPPIWFLEKKHQKSHRGDYRGLLISCCQNWFGWDRILEVDFGGNNHGFPLLYLFFFTTPLHTFLPLSFLHRYPRLGDTRRSVGTAVASCRAEQRAAGAQTWQRMCLGVAGRCLLRADRMMLKNQPPNQMLKSW